MMFGNRLVPQRTDAKRDGAVGGHFRHADAVDVFARDWDIARVGDRGGAREGRCK
jgi:hypothetical protein